MPPRDPHHAGDPRGLRGHRGPTGLNARDGRPDRSLWDEPPGAKAGGPSSPGQVDGPAPGADGSEEAIGQDATGRPGEPGRPRRLIIRTDGAARGNPGPASLGAVLIDAAAPGALHPSATPLASISEYLGVRTNNVAEYTGLLRALALAAELGAREVDLLLDSMLIVEQLHGRWKVKDAKLRPLWEEARLRLAGFERWSARHVRRAENHAADALANEAIDRAQAGGPAVVVRRSG